MNIRLFQSLFRTLCFILFHTYCFAQSKETYPLIGKKYTQQEISYFLNYYQKKKDTLGLVYTYAIKKANYYFFNIEEDKKAISTIYKYKNLVKKHSEDNYYHVLLELADYRGQDYKSLANSLSLCDSVLHYSERKNNNQLRRKVLTYKAYILMDTGEIKEFANVLSELYRYKNKWSRDPLTQIEYCYLSGFLHLKTKSYEASINYFKKALNLIKDNGIQNHMQRLSVLFLAQCYRISGDLPKAKQYASLGLDMVQGTNNIYLERWSYEELALINQQQKNYQSSTTYWTKYWESEKVVRELNIKKLNNSGINFELLEAELREANVQKQLILSDNRQKQLLTKGLSIICILLILLLGVAAWAYYQRVKIALQQRQMALYEGQELERNLIARELHDNIGSTLAGIKAQLDPAGSNFSLLTTHLDNLYQNVRTLSHVLHAEDIEQVGLRQSCQDFIQLIDKNGLVTFAVYGREIPLSALETKIIYRIIQELLTNALNHAKATKIYLNLLFEVKHLMISVEDNGIGFDVSKKTKGFGIKNIHKRIETLKGHIQIDTSSEGSSFLIIIPFGKLFSEYPK